MDDNHINNTISMLEERDKNNSWIAILKQEKNYRELKNSIGCIHKNLSYYDLLKILAKFCDVKEIVEGIVAFHRNMYLINRTQIAEKLLKRMGNANIDNWQKDFQK